MNEIKVFIEKRYVVVDRLIVSDKDLWLNLEDGTYLTLSKDEVYFVMYEKGLVIAPLSECEMAWGELPDWAEWVAHGDDGGWCCYEEKPWRMQEWFEPCNSHSEWGIVQELLGYDLPPTSDWKQSLTRRPKN